jgi:hypothetical protein
MADSDRGYYVYAVGHVKLLTGIDGLSGIDDAPVERTVVEQLAGLVSAVSMPALRSAEQSQEVSETGWLAGAVRAHEHVALQALEHAPILPMRFGTVFGRLDDVQTMLRRHQQALLSELRRLNGSTEWCLTARGTAESDHDPRAVEPTTGTAWLQSRQAALHARSSQADRLRQLPLLLRPLVRELVTTQRAGTEDTLRIWLLVDDPQRLRDTLDGLSGQLRELAVTVELTGPWPAYHFVRTDAVHSDVTRHAAGQPAQVTQ